MMKMKGSGSADAVACVVPVLFFPKGGLVRLGIIHVQFGEFFYKYFLHLCNVGL